MALALDQKGIIYCNLNIGYLKDFQGKKEEALIDLESALEMFQSLKDKEGLGGSALTNNREGAESEWKWWIEKLAIWAGK